MTKKATEPPRFEDVLAELEAIVRRLEGGELPLEESLGTFERGVGLVRSLTDRLAAIEQRVEVLVRGADGAAERRPLDDDDAD
jgi:exodeoxyribonuclease VII small subunit